MDSRLSITGLLGAAFALSVFCYLGDSIYLLLYVTLIMLVALMIFLNVSIQRQALGWSRIHTIAIGYVLWLVVLMYTSTLPGNSLLFFWLLACFPITLLVCSDFSEAEWHRLFSLFILAGMTSAIWGIAEFWSTGKRADGPLLDPNVWCAVNNLFFFGVLSRYMVDRKHGSIYLALLFIFSTASLVAYSRVGLVIFLAALAFVSVALLSKREFRTRMLLVYAVVLVSAGFVYGSAGLAEATSNKEGYTLDMKDQGWSQRMSMWDAAFNMYKEHPMTGVGPGTFKVHYPRFRTAADMTNSGNFVHNDYLQFLSEGGPVQLMFLLLLVGYLLVRLWRSYLATLKSGDESVTLLLIVAMGTTFVHSLMNFPLYNLSVQILLGFFFAYLIRGDISHLGINLDKPLLARVGGVVVVVYVAAVLVLDSVSGDIVYDNYRLPLTERIKNDQQSYLSTIDRLSTLRSSNPTNHFALATLYRMAMDEQTNPGHKYSLAIASAHSYQRGIELNPFNYRVRFYFARLLQEEPQVMEDEFIYQTSLALLQENVRLAPVFIENHMEPADYLKKTGNEKRRIEYS